MAAVQASVTFSGPWEQVIKALSSPVFEKNLKLEGEKAMRINIKILEREVRKAVRDAKVHGPANAFMTLDLKSGTSPLVDSSQLFSAVGSVYHRWNFAQVGIVGRGQVAKVARWVHEGRTIPVSKKMFGLFLILHRLSLSHDPSKLLAGIRSRRIRALWKAFQKHSPGRVFPKVTKGTIVIPERPFLNWALESRGADDVYHNFFTMVMRAIVRVPGIKATRVPKYRT